MTLLLAALLLALLPAARAQAAQYIRTGFFDTATIVDVPAGGDIAAPLLALQGAPSTTRTRIRLQAGSYNFLQQNLARINITSSVQLLGAGPNVTFLNLRAHQQVVNIQQGASLEFRALSYTGSVGTQIMFASAPLPSVHPAGALPAVQRPGRANAQPSCPRTPLRRATPVAGEQRRDRAAPELRPRSSCHSVPRAQASPATAPRRPRTPSFTSWTPSFSP